MKSLALVGLLAGASLAVGAVAPQRLELRPYASVNAPPEATTAATGGLGVVAVERVKSTVVVQYTGGAPCGPMPRYDDRPAPASSATAADSTGIWLPVGVGVGSVATLGLVGFLLLRRSRG
ncbi:MAG TPA: hypothetical protein VM529_07145 [Gemmata sp.]|nr:hypothetical protein [Gemmata sp.]